MTADGKHHEDVIDAGGTQLYHSANVKSEAGKVGQSQLSPAGRPNCPDRTPSRQDGWGRGARRMAPHA